MRSRGVVASAVEVADIGKCSRIAVFFCRIWDIHVMHNTKL